MAATPLQILLEDAFVNIVVGGTPTTGPFDFDFPFFSETDDIKVKRTDDATGVVTDLTVTTDYTVQGTSVQGGFQGGTITLVSSDSDATLLIYRDIGVKRTDWFPDAGPFDITTLNQTFARIFAIAQEINESIDRGLKLPITEAGTVMEVPELADRANKFLGFDAAGAAIASTAVTGTVVSTFMETVLDDLTSAAALTTLGVNSARAQALGDASIKTVGVADGNVIAADATGLPVIDGSQLTNVIAAWTAITGKPDVMLTESDMLWCREEQPSGTDAGTFTNGAWRTRLLNTEYRSTLSGAGLCFDIAYDAQTGNFTVGQVLTGGTSGATATIVADNDGGATGTLTVIGITGTFADNETITDPVTGSADANIPSGVQDANQIYLPAGDYIIQWRAPTRATNLSRSKLYNITASADVALGASCDSSGSTGHTESAFYSFVTLASAAVLELQHRCSTTRSGDGFGAGVGFGEVEIYSEIKVNGVL